MYPPFPSSWLVLIGFAFRNEARIGFRGAQGPPKETASNGCDGSFTLIPPPCLPRTLHLLPLPPLPLVRLLQWHHTPSLHLLLAKLNPAWSILVGATCMSSLIICLPTCLIAFLTLLTKLCRSRQRRLKAQLRPTVSAQTCISAHINCFPLGSIFLAQPTLTSCPIQRILWAMCVIQPNQPPDPHHHRPH